MLAAALQRHPVEGLTDFTETRGVINTLIVWQAGLGNRNRSNYHDSCHLLNAHSARQSACIISLNPVMAMREGMGWPATSSVVSWEVNSLLLLDFKVPIPCFSSCAPRFSAATPGDLTRKPVATD